MKKIISAVVVGFLCVSLSVLVGCNTVKGAGKDIADTGRDIERATYKVTH